MKSVIAILVLFIPLIVVLFAATRHSVKTRINKQQFTEKVNTYFDQIQNSLNDDCLRYKREFDFHTSTYNEEVNPSLREHANARLTISNNYTRMQVATCSIYTNLRFPRHFNIDFNYPADEHYPTQELRAAISRFIDANEDYANVDKMPDTLPIYLLSNIALYVKEMHKC